MQLKFLFPYLLHTITADAHYNYSSTTPEINVPTSMNTTAAKSVQTAASGPTSARFVRNSSEVEPGLPIYEGPWAPYKYPLQPEAHMRFIYELQPSRQNSYTAGIDRLQKYQSSSVAKLQDTRTTIVTLFFPAEGDNSTTPVRRTEKVYLERMRRLLATGKPIILYTSPAVAKKLRQIRDDPYLIIVEDYSSVNEIPNIRGHVKNFEEIQPKIFEQLVVSSLSITYNRPHNMKVYNAKAWVVRDSIEHNPFGSDYFFFSDAGMFMHEAPEQLKAWADTKKLIATLEYNQVRNDSIVISQVGRLKPGNHRCWSAPNRPVECHSFAANGFYGHKDGMKRFANAMFKEFDLMNANGLYVGREEFIMSRVATSNQGLFQCFEAWKDPLNIFTVGRRWWGFCNAFTAEEPLELVDPFKNASPATWYLPLIQTF